MLTKQKRTRSSTGCTLKHVLKMSCLAKNYIVLKICFFSICIFRKKTAEEFVNKDLINFITQNIERLERLQTEALHYKIKVLSLYSPNNISHVISAGLVIPL